MQNLPENHSRPPFSKRFFSWRTFGRCLIGIAFLATLLAVLYVEENWRGKRAWENYKRQAEARSVEFDWQKVVPPAVPDDQNFAMTPLLAPLYDFNPLPLKPGQSAWRDEAGYERVSNLATNLPVDPHSIAPEKMLQDLQPYQPAMQELIAASHRSYARYNIDYAAEDPQTILLPHLAIMKKLLRLFAYRATAEIALNRTDAAIADIDMSFYLADTIKGEPFLISHLVRDAMINIASIPIRDGLAQHQWSDSQLKHLEALLASINELENYRDAMRSERAIFGIRYFDLMRSHPRSYDQYGIQPTLMPSGWVYLEQVSYHRTIDEKILPSFDPSLGRVYPPKVDEISRSTPLTFGERAALFIHHRFLARLMAGPFQHSLQKTAYDQTKIDELLIACAIERYNLVNTHLPEHLETLIPKFIDRLPQDICSSEPLKYHRISNNQFTLYSVGWNQTDDGGKLSKDPEGHLDLNRDDWPWTPSDTN